MLFAPLSDICGMAYQKRKPVRKSSTGDSHKKPAQRTKSVKSRVNPKFTGAGSSTRKKKTPTHTAQKRAALNKAGLGTRKAPNNQKTVDKQSFDSIIHDLRIVYAGKKVNILVPPWEDRDIVKALGGEYSTRLKQWVVLGDLDSRLQPYRSEPFSLARWYEDKLNNREQTINRSENLFTPREHQRKGIDAIVRACKAGWRGFIEADDTGIGKTLTGLLGASEAAKAKGFTSQHKAKLLIMTVNNSLPNWRNTIERSGIDNLEILLLNYEQNNKLLVPPSSAANAKKKSTKNRRISSQGSPLIHWDFIICDESQKIKNVTSQRTQAFQQIAEYSHNAQHAPFIIWMSATVAQTPLEAAYLSPLIGQAVKKNLTINSWFEWLQDNDFHVTKTKSGGWKWIKPKSPEDTQALREQEEDLARLSSILFSPKAPSIRRLAKDIAGWPEQNRIGLPVELTLNAKARYKTLWTEFRKEMSLIPRGKNPQGALAVQLRFAQKASFLRTDQTVELIQDMLEQGKQVAVSLRFIESLDAIKRELERKNIPVAEFSGRNVKTREQERLAFQKGKAPVILFTVTESVSFHAKESLRDGTTGSANERVLFIHDMRYSAMDLKQITGRTHRDGQNCIAYLLYSEGTVEETIAETMLLKLKNMTILSGDDESEGFVEILDKINL